MNSTSEPAGRRSLAVLIPVGIAFSVALLLMGAAAGLLIRMPSENATPKPSEVDIGFAQDMSVHHEQAVTMATLARERASDVEVRQLAFDIETNQRGQIGRMQGWLSLWGQPAQSLGEPMSWMHGDGMSGQHGNSSGHGDSSGGSHGGGSEHGRSMPGMATSEELAHLRSLRGPEFDVEFLQLMLRHHEGGVGMARYGSEHASLAPVRDLARNMLIAQGNESDLMRQMLSARGAHPLG